MLIPSYSIGQSPVPVDFETRRVVVLTQTCDLANDKTSVVTVAEVQNAQSFVDAGILKPADIKGPLRSGRIWGLYFLPADAALGLTEMIVDFRRLHTVKLDVLRVLCRAGKRPAGATSLPRTPCQAFRRHVQPHRVTAPVRDAVNRSSLPHGMSIGEVRETRAVGERGCRYGVG